MTAFRKVAVYGLGNMGFPLAARVAKAFEVYVADLDTDAVARGREQFGAIAIERPEDIADCEVVVLSLPGPQVSRAVLSSIAAHLPRGATVIETSTVNPVDVHACARQLEPHGIRLLDASVLAGVAQMQSGEATLAIGGDAADVARVKGVLDAIAQRQVVFGPLGAGAAAKVINNAVAHAVMVVVAEAGSMAKAAGVDIDQLVAMLSDSKMGIHRPLTYRYAERVRNGDYAGGMPLDAARKDSVLALQLAQDLGVPIFAILGSHAVYEMGVAAGHGRDDYAAIAKLWDSWGKPAV